MEDTANSKDKPGIRENKGKAPISLILSRALIEVAKVSEFGAKKYKPHNYRRGMKWSFFVDAIMRHLIKYCIGQRIDYDPSCKGCQEKNCQDHSGLSHLSHISWNALALLEYEIENIGEDDIFKGYSK